MAQINDTGRFDAALRSSERRIAAAADAAVERILSAFPIMPPWYAGLIMADRLLLQLARRPSGLRIADAKRRGLDPARADAFVVAGLLLISDGRLTTTPGGDAAWHAVISKFADAWPPDAGDTD